MSELLKKFVCSVDHDKGNAMGAFVERNYVLTSAHVIEGARREHLRFTASNGSVAGMRFKEAGGRHFIDKHNDLALIQLDRMIAPQRTKVVPLKPSQHEDLYLSDMFKGSACVSRTQFETIANKLKDTGLLNGNKIPDFLHSFRSSAEVRQGYSGSPVMTPDGGIVSIVCAIDTTNIELSSIVNLASDIFKLNSIKLDNPFLGVRNEALVKFYQTSMARLNEPKVQPA